VCVAVKGQGTGGGGATVQRCGHHLCNRSKGEVSTHIDVDGDWVAGLQVRKLLPPLLNLMEDGGDGDGGGRGDA
jgi:hypothetical protein